MLAGKTSINSAAASRVGSIELLGRLLLREARIPPTEGGGFHCAQAGRMGGQERTVQSALCSFTPSLLDLGLG